MQLHRVAQRIGLAVVVLGASLWFAPSAFAHSHVRVRVGISVPGITVGVGNCWRCGYWPPSREYYPEPVYYYPAPVYYTPRPVYYGYGYQAPSYPRYYRHHDYYRSHRYYRSRGWHHSRGRYYHHSHH